MSEGTRVDTAWLLQEIGRLHVETVLLRAEIARLTALPAPPPEPPRA